MQAQCAAVAREGGPGGPPFRGGLRFGSVAVGRPCTERCGRRLGGHCQSHSDGHRGVGPSSGWLGRHPVSLGTSWSGRKTRGQGALATLWLLVSIRPNHRHGEARLVFQAPSPGRRNLRSASALTPLRQIRPAAACSRSSATPPTKIGEIVTSSRGCPGSDLSLALPLLVGTSGRAIGPRRVIPMPRGVTRQGADDCVCAGHAGPPLPPRARRAQLGASVHVINSPPAARHHRGRRRMCPCHQPS